MFHVPELAEPQIPSPSTVRHMFEHPFKPTRGRDSEKARQVRDAGFLQDCHSVGRPLQVLRNETSYVVRETQNSQRSRHCLEFLWLLLASSTAPSSSTSERGDYATVVLGIFGKGAASTSCILERGQQE